MSGRPGSPTMTARAIWLVRHGRRRDFDDPGWAATAARPHDPPLSAPGRVQAERLSWWLVDEGIGRVFSSPFLRCVETAAPLAERLELPILVEIGLSEWLNREWFRRAPELHSLGELARRFPRVDLAYRPRGTARYGESGEEALRRSGAVARLLAEQEEGTLVLVGHGASVLGALAGLLEAEPEGLPEVGYGWAVELRSGNGGWRMERGPVPPEAGAESRTT